MDDTQGARETPLRRYPYLPRMVVGIAVILFSTAGIAAIMGWRSSIDAPAGGVVPTVSAANANADAVAAPAVQKRARAKARAWGKCAECGLIESFGDIKAHPDDTVAGSTESASAGGRNEPTLPATAQTTMVVRMADGTRRVISGANPAFWRVGERVVIIAGSTPPHR